MTVNLRNLATNLFDAGEKLKVSRDGRVKLPVSFDHEQELLFIKTENGYKLIPLEPDVKKVYLEVTTQCNFSCVTCIRNSWNEDLGQMEWGTFEKFLDSLQGLPYLETVHFGGFGEPFSHPRILDMLKAVKGRGLRVEIITNGSLLTDNIIKELISLGLDRIYVSLDGPDEEEYNDLGNINDKTLKDIWAESGYISFSLAVKNFKFPSCTDCKFLEGCTMADSNEMDCWGNSPSCAECLWSRSIVACP